jgi:hypothetical protein
VDLHLDFEDFWLAASADEFRPSPVRDAEVPGSNPGSPTTKTRSEPQDSEAPGSSEA